MTQSDRLVLCHSPSSKAYALGRHTYCLCTQGRRTFFPLNPRLALLQGAFMAALYSQGLAWEQMHHLVREYARQMSSVQHLLWDLTLPIMSIFNGVGFDRVVRETFKHGAQQIEDLWLRFVSFCHLLCEWLWTVLVSFPPLFLSPPISFFLLFCRFCVFFFLSLSVLLSCPCFPDLSFLQYHLLELLRL